MELSSFLLSLCVSCLVWHEHSYGSGFINVDSEDRSQIYLRLNSNSQVGLLPITQKSFGFKALA